MHNEAAEGKSAGTRTPADMLARQVELLEAIRESLDNQQRLFLHMAEKQDTRASQLNELSADVTYLTEALLPDAEAHPGHQWVKVQDVNVPFINLSMFLVKLALASIPAAIVIGVLWLFAVALFGILGLGLF